MSNVYEQHDVDEAEEVDLMEIRAGDQPVGWAGITRPSGHVYLSGDLHPQGSSSAMLVARLQDVPYISVSAVRVLFPAEWLAAECLHDHDRLRVIANLVSWVRSQ